MTRHWVDLAKALDKRSHLFVQHPRRDVRKISGAWLFTGRDPVMVKANILFVEDSETHGW